MEYNTGGVRDTGGKGRCDLLPHAALLRVSHHMENALEHHEERNWEKGLPMHCFLDSAMRHIFKYMDGWKDEDHLAAATSNILMAMWTEEKIPNMQDIPTRLNRPPEYVSETTEHPSEGSCECENSFVGCVCTVDSPVITDEMRKILEQTRKISKYGISPTYGLES